MYKPSAAERSLSAAVTLLMNRICYLVSTFQQFVEFFRLGAFDKVDDEPNDGITCDEDAGEYQNWDIGFLQPAVEQIGKEIGSV